MLSVTKFQRQQNMQILSRILLNKAWMELVACDLALFCTNFFLLIFLLDFTLCWTDCMEKGNSIFMHSVIAVNKRKYWTAISLSSAEHISCQREDSVDIDCTEFTLNTIHQFKCSVRGAPPVLCSSETASWKLHPFICSVIATEFVIQLSSL